MKTINKTPKELIVEIRNASCMTDTDIADAVNISQSTISRLRSGALSDTSSENWRAIFALYTKVTQKLSTAEKKAA